MNLQHTSKHSERASKYTPPSHQEHTSLVNDLSPWMQERCYYAHLSQFLDEHELTNLGQCIETLPFTYNAVGGKFMKSKDNISNTIKDSRYGPCRGVCVVGDRTRPVNNKDIRQNKHVEQNKGMKYTIPIILPETHWTLSQNISNTCTLTSKTSPIPEALDNLVPIIRDLFHSEFPCVDVDHDGFCVVAVANHYIAGEPHKINTHTDDQEWYGDSPVYFTSITWFPDGEPDEEHGHNDATFRFQVYDESLSKFVPFHLEHASICIMRADVKHRVLPPLKKFVDRGQAKDRINITFRSSSNPLTDPLGFMMCIANHTRYYGVPKSINIPSDVEVPELLIKHYQEWNPDVKLRYLCSSSTKRKQEKKDLLAFVSTEYRKSRKMAGKTNCVLETLIELAKI